jgi:two-component system, NarL family, nitrate/nitrite response regulator NarL
VGKLRLSDPVSTAANTSADPSVPTYLVAPSALLRSGIEHSLSRSQFQVVASVGSFEDLTHRVAHEGDAALFLVDATRRHDEALRDLKSFTAKHPGARGVMLVETCEPENLLSAYKQGIDGYLTTSVSEEALRAYLSLIMMGEAVISSSALAAMRDTAQLWHSAEAGNSGEPWDGIDRRNRHGLSFREASILRCLMEGGSNKVIARKCDIAEATVKVHLKSICRKLNVNNRTQAALWAKAHLHGIERRSNR